MAEKRAFHYDYVDNYGYNWTIDVKETGVSRHSSDIDYYDKIWTYVVARSDRGIFHSGEMKMRDGEYPNLEDILLDFTTYIISVSLGFSKKG